MVVKYQVFISSTYEDLRPEREQLLKATLELGHIPVGMEMFSAANEEQWKIITRQIDDCDYYAVIVAHRYGSTVDGISFTEKEYDYAVAKNIPVLGFVIDDSAQWQPNDIDTEPIAKSSLIRFKSKVKEKLVSFWTTPEDLHGKYSVAITKQIASTPRPGWARATDVAGPEVVKELARLSGENADLRIKLKAALHQAEDDLVAERNRTILTLRKNEFTLSFWYADGKDWEDKTNRTMYGLFYLLGPELMIEKATDAIIDFLGIMLRPDKERFPRQTNPVPTNTVKLLISDFVALGLFEPSQRRHTVTDTNEYWTLSDLGSEVLADIRRSKLENPQAEEESHDDLQIEITA